MPSIALVAVTLVATSLGGNCKLKTAEVAVLLDDKFTFTKLAVPATMLFGGAMSGKPTNVALMSATDGAISKVAVLLAGLRSFSAPVVPVPKKPVRGSTKLIDAVIVAPGATVLNTGTANVTMPVVEL